jgi:DNA-binding GntR family transcriptional regulator
MIDHDRLRYPIRWKRDMQVTLNEKAYQHIRDRLTGGKLTPGERLVTRNLAEEIGISLAPVREAISRLASEGLVEHVPGAGAFVREISRQDLEELYTLRDAIESCAASEAAKFATDSQLEEMDLIVEQWCSLAEEIVASPKKRATKSQLDKWLDNEQAFHAILMEASRNRLLAKVIDDHRAISFVFDAQRSTPTLLTAELAERTSQGKKDIMTALHNRDAELARKLMSQQIQQGKKTVLEFLRKQSR